MNTSKKKTAKPITQKKERPKIPMFLWSLAELRKWGNALKEEEVKTFCEQLMWWGSQSNETDFEDFYIRMAILPRRMQEYRAEYPDIDKTWHFVRMVLGRRKEEMLRKHDPNYLKHTLRKYHQLWQEIHEENAELKARLAEKVAREPIELIVKRD